MIADFAVYLRTLDDEIPSKLNPFKVTILVTSILVSLCFRIAVIVNVPFLSFGSSNEYTSS